MAVLLVEVFSFVFLLCSTISNASTHWIVTEGGKLQTQVDSVFNLNRPYDLLAFLRQEKRAQFLQTLQDELVRKKKDIDQSDKDEPGLEERYYKEDSDCIIAGKPLTEYDLYISTVLPLQNKNINGEDYLQPSPESTAPPDCISSYELPFSMHSFDHLHGVKLRKNLTAAAELGLINAVCPEENVNDYGSRINDALKRNNTSWVLYNMAAFYWRIKGNAFNVVECLRRALHFSPRQYKDVALISLANILHRAKRSMEASVLIHAAIDINSDLNVNHFTLGNIYAVLGDYNKSITYFENTLLMQKDFEAAYRRKHAVKCHHKIETALEAQHRTLQKTLNELRSYQKKHEIFEKERFILSNEKVLDSEKEKQNQNYESIKDVKKKLDLEELCNQKSCEWFPKKVSKLTYQSVSEYRDIFPSWPPYSENQNTEDIGNLESKTSREYLDPIKEPRYVKREEYTPEELSTFIYKKKNWPDKQECDTYVQKIPAWNDFPTTYLPPENKGFDVRAILSEGLGLTNGVGHDLPWYPPVCVNLANIPESTQSYDHLEAIKKRAEIPLKLYDSYMRPLLQSLVPDATEEEIGQRILTALKSHIGPAWLLYNVAGLYWRVIGNNYHSIECLRRSLHFVPTKYRDVPLVNLANILYKWGRVDEAIILIREASTINSMEPETHFMLANLLAAKGNTSGAIYHYEECLHQQPDHQQALTMLRALNCYIKFHRAAQSSAPVTTMIMKKAVENAPTIFCRKDNQGFENCVFEATGNCYKPENEKLKILCEGNDCNDIISGKRRPHIKLEFSSGIIQRKLFTDEGSLQISPDDCVIFNDGSKSEGCNLDHFKYYTDATKSRKAVELERHIRSYKFVAMPTAEECQNQIDKPNIAFASTWISLSTKGIVNEDYIDFNMALDDIDDMHPLCDARQARKSIFFDDVDGIKRADQLKYSAEIGLKDLLLDIGPYEKIKTIEEVGTRIAIALQNNVSSWVLASLATLYWRVKGNSSEAVKCALVSYSFAPERAKDIALLSMVDILHRSNRIDEAVVVLDKALDTDTPLVATHFVAANLLASQKNYEAARLFLLSTLSLQKRFTPAKERLLAINCHLLKN